MRVRRRIWLGLLAVLLAVGVAVLGLSAFKRSLLGPRHEFPLPERPAFLTEDLTLAMAREALSRDGFDPAEWQAIPDNRTSAPDGRQDQFLSRNQINPNQGSVIFRGPGSRARCVSVELVGEQVVCVSSWGK